MLVMKTKRLLSYVIGMQLRVKIKQEKLLDIFLNMCRSKCKSSFASRKKTGGKESGGGGLRTYFFEKPSGIFHFLTLPLEISDKTKVYLWKFHKS